MNTGFVRAPLCLASVPSIKRGDREIKVQNPGGDLRIINLVKSIPTPVLTRRGDCRAHTSNTVSALFLSLPFTQPSPDARSFDHYSATHVVGIPTRLRHFVGVFADDVSRPQHSPKSTCVIGHRSNCLGSTIVPALRRFH